MPFLQEVKNLLSIETGVVVWQLALFSELGVLTRVYLSRLFNDGCDDGWGLCLTSQGGPDKTYGAQFADLPANMLGCFCMGLLSTAAVLGLKSKKNVAFLPASHSWQNHKELLVGLRTGYCGSLTTFASWQLALIQLLIGVKSGDGGQWQQWLWGWIIGFELAFASQLIGEHTALFIDSKILREEPNAEVTQLERPTEASEEAEDLYGSQELDEVIHGDEHKDDDGHTDHQHHDKQREGKVEMTDLERPIEPAQEAEDLYGTHQSHDTSQWHNFHDTQQSRDVYDTQQSGGICDTNQSQQAFFPSHSNNGRREAPQADGHKPNGHHKTPHSKAGAKNVNAQESMSGQAAKENSSWSTVRSKLTPTFLVCLVLCLLLTVLWIVLAIVDNERKHSGRRQQWFALLFAPFGCILRWLLSKLNTRSDKHILPWFPLGTYLANMIACIVDLIIGGITNRYTLGYWPGVILPAIRVGYAGSLSTVSTFVAEVRVTLLVHSAYLHAQAIFSICVTLLHLTEDLAYTLSLCGMWFLVIFHSLCFTMLHAGFGIVYWHCCLGDVPCTCQAQGKQYHDSSRRVCATAFLDCRCELSCRVGLKSSMATFIPLSPLLVVLSWPLSSTVGVSGALCRHYVKLL